MKLANFKFQESIMPLEDRGFFSNIETSYDIKFRPGRKKCDFSEKPELKIACVEIEVKFN